MPATPFPTVVGTERMNVTAVAGASWTVVRGAGGTAAAAHFATCRVMSTPLPLDASGKIMQMCICGRRLGQRAGRRTGLPEDR